MSRGVADIGFNFVMSIHCPIYHTCTIIPYEITYAMTSYAICSDVKFHGNIRTQTCMTYTIIMMSLWVDAILVTCKF